MFARILRRLGYIRLDHIQCLNHDTDDTILQLQQDATVYASMWRETDAELMTTKTRLEQTLGELDDTREWAVQQIDAAHRQYLDPAWEAQPDLIGIDPDPFDLPFPNMSEIHIARELGEPSAA